MKATRLLVALSLSSAFALANAQDRTDRSYELYRYVVLGCTGEAGAKSAASQPTHRRTEGPYARHLINNGFSTDEALAAAQRVGEQPGEVVEGGGTPTRQLTPYEAYEKVVLGQQIDTPPKAGRN